MFYLEEGKFRHALTKKKITYNDNEFRYAQT